MPRLLVSLEAISLVVIICNLSNQCFFDISVVGVLSGSVPSAVDLIICPLPRETNNSRTVSSSTGQHVLCRFFLIGGKVRHIWSGRGRYPLS